MAALQLRNVLLAAGVVCGMIWIAKSPEETGNGEARAAASTSAVGWWGTLDNSTGGTVREVLQLREDGLYATGICMRNAVSGNCIGNPVAQILGEYRAQDGVLDLEHGLMPRAAMDNFERSTIDLRGDGKAERYRYRVEPTTRRLLLTDSGGRVLIFHGLGVDPTGWKKRQ